MHNRNNQKYNCFMDDMIFDMKQTVDIALKAGIKKDNIILDAGIGFAKSYENNLEAIDRIDEFRNPFLYPFIIASVIFTALAFSFTS